MTSGVEMTLKPGQIIQKKLSHMTVGKEISLDYVKKKKIKIG